MSDIISIGDVIKNVRKVQGISQETLSDGVCDRKYISKLENDMCSPTVDMVKRISDKLAVNVFSVYSASYHHYDWETHLIIEEINENLSPTKIDNLRTIVEDNKNRKAFAEGEPRQFILYAEAGICSCSRDFCGAINFLEEGLTMKYPSLEELSIVSHYSNIDCAILLGLGVNYSRIRNYEKGKLYFSLALDKVLELLKKANLTQKHIYSYFELNFIGRLFFQYFKYLHNCDIPFEDTLDDIISILKENSFAANLPELLLCRSHLFREKGDSEKANEYFEEGHYIGVFMYGQERMIKLEQSILGL